MKFLRILYTVLSVLMGLVVVVVVVIGCVIDPFTRKLTLSVLTVGFLFVYVPYRLVRDVRTGSPRMMVIRALLIQLLLASALILSLYIVVLHVNIFFFSAGSPELSPHMMALLQSIGKAITGIVNPIAAFVIAAALMFLTSGVLLLRDERTGIRYFQAPESDEPPGAVPLLKRDIHDWFPDERALVRNLTIFVVLLLFAPILLGLAIEFYSSGPDREISAKGIAVMLSGLFALLTALLSWLNSRRLKSNGKQRDR